MKIEFFFGISTESENLSKIGGKPETEGNASYPQRGWTPLWETATLITVNCFAHFKFTPLDFYRPSVISYSSTSRD